MPRAFDRKTPEADKDPNRFGTDYTDPFGAIHETAWWTGNTMRDAVDKQNEEFRNNLQDFFDKIFARREAWIAEFEGKTGLNIDEGPIKFLQSLQAALKQDRLDWVTEFEAKTGLNIDEGSAKFLQSLYLKLGWTELANKLQAAIDRQAAAQKDWDNFVQRFYRAFAPEKARPPLPAAGRPGDVGLKRVTSQNALDALELWVQSKFGTDSPISKAIDNLQAFLDGISAIFKPDRPPGATPVKDAIEAILGINNKAESAAEQAANALLGISAIRAEQAGGFVDEVVYPMADELPATEYELRYDPTGITAGAGTLGPDGSFGVLEYKIPGNTLKGNREIIYRKLDKPLTKTSGKVTATFSKAVTTNALKTVKAYAFICARMSAGDKSCLRVKIGLNTAQFQQVNFSGVVSNLTNEITIPEFRTGDEFIFEYYLAGASGNPELLLKKGTSGAKDGILCASKVGGFALPPGQYIGVGAFIPQYTPWLNKSHPCPEFAGWTWV